VSIVFPLNWNLSFALNNYPVCKHCNSERARRNYAERKAAGRITQGPRERRRVAHSVDRFRRRWAPIISAAIGEPVEVDHVIPVARGGTDTRENLRFIPARMNAMKGKRLDSEIGPNEPELYDWITCQWPTLKRQHGIP
jgi:hypothetical protein